MKIAKGPRPWTIHAFAIAFLCGAVLAFLQGFWELNAQQSWLQANAPRLDWNEDAVIVMLSVRLSIALIPIALVWLFASRIARWLVTLMGLGKLINIPGAIQTALDGMAVDAMWTASITLSVLAIPMLFLRSSNGWFSRREEVDPATFA